MTIEKNLKLDTEQARLIYAYFSYKESPLNLTGEMDLITREYMKRYNVDEIQFYSDRLHYKKFIDEYQAMLMQK